MRQVQLLVGLLSSLLAISAEGRVHTYGADLHESDWSHNGSSVYCQLRHTIPNYGEAIFSKSVDEELEFSVIVGRSPKNKDKEATLQSRPPEWKPGIATRDLGTVDISKSSKPFTMGRDMARRLMLELEQGMVPTFFYSDWADGKDEVNVSISSVNFGKARKDFVQCLAGLLPYNFKDIRDTQVYFPYDEYNLSKNTRKRLDKIANYIKGAPDDVVIEIEGHTDARGFRRYNKQLSLKRARAVQEYLRNKGISDTQMSIYGYGEGNPATTNRTSKGRAKNRRVVITLVK